MLRCGVGIKASVALDLWLNHGVFTGERRSADPGRHHVTTHLQLDTYAPCANRGCWVLDLGSCTLAGTHVAVQIYRTPKMAGVGIEGKDSVVIGRPNEHVVC